MRIDPPDIRSLPAFRAAVLMAGGVLMAKASAVPAPVILWGTVVLTGLAVILFVRLRGTSSLIESAAVILLWISFGASRLVISNGPIAADELPMGREISVIGTIVSHPQRTERSRFALEIEETVSNDGIRKSSAGAIVSLPKDEIMKDSIGLGLHVAITGVLEEIPKRRNPGEFDPTEFYQAQGIQYKMTASPNGISIFGEGRGFWLERAIVIPIRLYVSDRINLWIGGEEGELLRGLILGDRSGMTYETREAFTRSGVAHVLAVSGAHVAIVGSFFFFTFRLLRMSRLVTIVFTGCGFFFFMLLTGANPPVVRATIMGVMVLIGMFSQRMTNPVNSIGVAALVILTLDPRQLFDIGFQLSFAAVLSLLYAGPLLNDFLKRRVNAETIFGRAILAGLQLVGVTAVATLGTLPFVASYFGQVSVVGLVANLPVILGVTASIYTGFVSLITGLIIPFVGSAFAELTRLLLYGTLSVTDAFSRPDFATVRIDQLDWLEALTFYSFLLLLLHWRTQLKAKRFVFLTLVFLNCSIWTSPSAAADDVDSPLRVWILDVGQGDAIVVEVPGGQTILIDAGPKSPFFDAGERTIAPFLRRRGIETISAMVISHPHSDHIGGAASILREFNVEKIIDCGQPVRSRIYHEYRWYLDEERCAFVAATKGMILEGFLNMRLFILHPSIGSVIADTTVRPPELNNTSVVFKLVYGGTSFLFSGDAEEVVEERLVETYGSFLSSTVLKVGHHGSATSSTADFVVIVQPQYAAMSVGARNKFGHPSSMVIERLRNRGTTISRTDIDGAILYESNGKQVRQSTWRE